MSDQNASTLPPPDDLAGLMGELRASLERTSELCVKVAGRLTVLALAELTAEHRLNVVTHRVDGHDVETKDHEQRLLRLEGLLTDPPAAAESTAAE